MAWLELLKPWTLFLFISQLTETHALNANYLSERAMLTPDRGFRRCPHPHNVRDPRSSRGRVDSGPWHYSCSDDSWRLINNDCFKIMDSPRLFGNASVLCLETGGVLLSYKNRQVLSDLDITSPTWLENSQEMDNITYGLHPSLKHKNLTNGQRCPSFSPNSTLITFDCDALSTVVCQLKHSNTERGKGIHLKLLVAIVISGVIFTIFLALIVYSAKRRLDDVDGREPNTVVYGKYKHLHQTEVEKCKTFTDDAIVLEDISIPVNGEQSNGVPVEESVRIKHGKYVQFSVPSTESEQATFNT